MSIHFARPIVRSVLAWLWPVAAETCSLVMNWFYCITVLCLDGNISIKIKVFLVYEFVCLTVCILWWNYKQYTIKVYYNKLSHSQQQHVQCTFQLRQAKSINIRIYLSDILHFGFIPSKTSFIAIETNTFVTKTGPISPTRCNNCVFILRNGSLYIFRVTISPIIGST